jgi:hypothetical protein
MAFSGRFHDSAAREFNEHAVADFVFGHGCGILYHAMPGIRTSNPSVNSRRMQNLNALFGAAYRERQRFSVPQLGYLGYQMTK